MLTSNGSGTPTEVGCWAHARRRFVDAQKRDPEADRFVRQIGRLYKVEKDARNLSNDQRYAMHQAKSVPILDELFAEFRKTIQKRTPKELLFKAIQYALNQESVLRRYCADGRLSTDNNECERALRLTAIGRKLQLSQPATASEALFFGAQRGGKTGAILYTILSSARRHGLNEYEYLYDLLVRLSDLSSHAELIGLLPDQWSPESERS